MKKEIGKESKPVSLNATSLFGSRDDLPVWILSENQETSGEYMLITCSNSKGTSSAIYFSGKTTEVNASDFVQTPKERVLTDSERFRARIYSIYVTVGYAFLAVLMTFSILSFGGVVKARVVLTESMTPLIKPGDVVITTPVSRKTPEIGDIVTYVAKRFDGSPVGTFTHRIIDGDRDSGFVVKGDNNPAPDVQRPKYEDIAGVLIFVIPFVGTLMTPRSLAILVPTIFGIWLVVDALRKKD